MLYVETTWLLYMYIRAPVKHEIWGYSKFYLSYFSTKPYGMTTHWNRLKETIPMRVRPEDLVEK